VPDLLVSGDKFDSVEVDPHDPTTTSKPEAPMQSLNQLPVVTDLVGARSPDHEHQFLCAIEERTRIMKRAILISLEGGVCNTRRQRYAVVQL
jgi:hypothetical protein